METPIQEQELSQEEVSALLSGGPQGEPEPAPKVAWDGAPRPYDFRSPDQFSKDQMRALRMMYETLARRLASALSRHLRTTVEMGVNHIEQGKYSEFLAHIPNPALLSVLSLDPLPGRIFLAMDLQAVAVLVDRLLGGSGASAVRSQELTEIEFALIENVIAIFIETLQNSWRNLIRLQPRLEDINLNPQFVQIALPTDVAALAVLDLTFRQTTTTWSICIPYSVLKPIASKLSPYMWIESAADISEGKRPIRRDGALEDALRRTVVPVSVRLGSGEIGLKSLMSLQPGDVICLDTSVRHKLEVFVGDRLKFLAKPGQIGNNLAIQITDSVENGNSFPKE